MLDKVARLHFFLSLYIVNHFLKGTRFFSLKRRILNSCRGIKIGYNTKIVGPISMFGKLIVGSDVWIGRNLSVEGNGELIVEDNCDIAPNVTVYTGTHAIGDETRRAGPGSNGIVTIKCGCWIGGSSVILTNVTVGIGTVVGAGSVVNKDTPDNVLVAGNPATIKKHLP